jgi:peptide methionine sulfoxide reductase msrA/msrB
MATAISTPANFFTHAFLATTKKKTGEELKSELTQEQYVVTQENATEHPFANAYFDKFEQGIYVDVASGEPLFSSRDKFASDCGWPSFSKPIEELEIVQKDDLSVYPYRVEARSLIGGSHLGHVFDDGPKELGGLRYCINSAALKFVPLSEMEKEGNKDYIHLFA